MQTKSNFEDDVVVKSAGAGGTVDLTRMVEKQELAVQMDKKATKSDFKICLKYVNILHSQIK
jgi:hypothetical protein